MRKLIISYFALAVPALLSVSAAFGAEPTTLPAIASTFDFGPASPSRRAVVFFTCNACSSARFISIDGVSLTRDAGSKGIEIWSGPLPDGNGKRIVTAGADHGEIAMGAIIDVSGVARAEAGRTEYTADVHDGDVLCGIARDGVLKADLQVSRAVRFAGAQASCWNVSNANDLRLTAPSASAIVIFR